MSDMDRTDQRNSRIQKYRNDPDDPYLKGIGTRITKNIEKEFEDANRSNNRSKSRKNDKSRSIMGMTSVDEAPATGKKLVK